MGSLSTDDASQDDNGIIAVVAGHLTGTVNKLERAGNGLDDDVLRQCTVLFERGDRTIEQCASDFRIPFSHHNTEAHVGGVRDLIKVVVGEIMICGSHY